jgi:hypothetical protein
MFGLYLLVKIDVDFPQKVVRYRVLEGTSYVYGQVLRVVQCRVVKLMQRVPRQKRALSAFRRQVPRVPPTIV